MDIDIAEIVATRELITLPDDTVKSVFTTPDGILDTVKKIAAFEKEWTPCDASTEEGREATKAFARRFQRSRTYLENIGKKEADVAKQMPKIIDANRKIARDTIEAIEARILAPVAEWESKERRRKEAHLAALSVIIGYAAYTAEKTVAELKTAHADALECHPSNYEEFEEEFALAKRNALDSLEARIVERRQRDKDQEDLARLRAKDAEREARAQALTAIAQREADDKAREEAAQRERVDAATRHAQEIKEAAERARYEEAAKFEQAQQVERRRIAAEKAEADRRAADKEHRGKINRAIVAALLAETGMSSETAKKIVALIATGKLANVAINY